MVTGNGSRKLYFAIFKHYERVGPLSKSDSFSTIAHVYELVVVFTLVQVSACSFYLFFIFYFFGVWSLCYPGQRQRVLYPPFFRILIHAFIFLSSTITPPLPPVSASNPNFVIIVSQPTKLSSVVWVCPLYQPWLEKAINKIDSAHSRIGLTRQTLM